MSVDLVYTFDLWRAASGGIRRGTRYLDNLDVVAEADLERLAGWRGAELHVYGLYNNGKSLGALMGDAQLASNIETGVRALRLYEAWLSQKFGTRTLLKLGLYDLNSEFDTLDASGLFLGSAHGVGTDISQSGRNGPSIFPVTSLAARIEYRTPSGWALRTAVLDGVPGDPDRPKRTAVKLGRGDGALFIGEAQVPLRDGKLLLGAWRYTARFDRLDGTRARGNRGIYLRGERRLVREAADPEQGLAGFFRLGAAAGRTNMFGRFASAGLNYTGLIRGRDADQLGLAVAAAFTSRSYRRAADAERAETAIEFTYRASVAPWLSLQPNIQYVVNPGADRALGNALAIGLRAELAWRISP